MSSKFAEYVGYSDIEFGSVKQECVNQYKYRIDYNNKRFLEGKVAKTFRVCRKQNCKYVMKVQDISELFYKKMILNEINLMKYINKNKPNLTSKYIKNWDCEKNNYMVMEYIDGITLSKYPTKKIDKKIIKKLITALHSLHKIGIIHRDLKSSNIIITKNNDIKLIDFGNATFRKKLNKMDKANATRFDFQKLLECNKIDKKLKKYAIDYINKNKLIIK